MSGTRAAAEPFTLDVGGLTIAGDRWDGTGTPILLMHGGGQTRHSWDRTAVELAGRGRTVVTLDARGHGDSAWAPDGDYELGGFTTDLVGVIGTLDAPPILIGASLGGITGLCVAGENPGIAAALVMVDVVVDVEPQGIARIKSFMGAHTGGFASLDEVADAVAAYNPTRKRPRNLDGLKKNVRLRADGRWYWHWDPAFLRSDDDEPRRLTSPDRLTDAAKNLTAPTLIVRGGSSDVVSQAGIDSMKQLVPHAEVADVRGAGHMVAGDDNQVFAAAIEEFLDRHEL